MSAELYSNYVMIAHHLYLWKRITKQNYSSTVNTHHMLLPS